MTEQVLRKLFDYQKFSRNQKLEAIIQDTQSRQVPSLSENELSYVNAAGILEVMGYHEDPPKDDPWIQH